MKNIYFSKKYEIKRIMFLQCGKTENELLKVLKPLEEIGNPLNYKKLMKLS